MEERVNLLGGKLRLKSRPGAGTSVYVEVPILKAIHEPSSSSSLNSLNA
jgi:nitrate/nitrite-specific signal transduction histidine kinase